VQYVVGEFDAIWDSSTAAIGSFVDALGAARWSIRRRPGDRSQHRPPTSSARRSTRGKLAFAEECELLATRG